MKGMFYWGVTLLIVLTLCLSVQAQSDLEERIGMILTQHSEHGGREDKRVKLEDLGRREEVHAILLKWLSKYKHTESGTNESLYLRGATWMLGAMKVKEAEEPLSQILLDQKVHENVRALAARSLGEIDAEASKEPLLTALANTSNYFGIRVEAAEAVAKTKDPQALRALNRYARQERDAYIKQKFEKAAQDMRARIRNRP